MATRNSASPVVWVISLVLFLALVAVLVFSVLQYRRARLNAVSGQDAALVEVRAGTAILHKRFKALEALLAAAPCALPETVEGLSLLTRGGDEVLAPSEAARTDELESGENPGVEPGAIPGIAPANEEDKSIEPESPTEPQASPTGAVSGEGRFRASNAMIEAATALVIYDTGQGLVMGTGFFVAPGILATNAHVVEQAHGPVLIINKQIGLTKGTVAAVSDGADRDYALLRVPDSASLPEALPLCGDIRKTDKVATWGFPGILSRSDPKFHALLGGDVSAIPEEIYSEGVVSVIYDTMPPMILHTAVTSHGNSGGPLVNQDGCVVGINTMIQTDDKSYRQTSVALGSKDLAAFLWQNGLSPRYHAGSKE